MPDPNIPGLSVPTSPAPPPGLINNMPLDPLTPPAVPAAPKVAEATTYTPQTNTVTPEQTVSSQIKNIIASGSPLMQQAEAKAKDLMGQRGLINSSIGIGAAQGALYSAATPIATADATNVAKVASENMAAQNAAAAAAAQAKNTGSIAQLQSDTTLAAQANQNQAQEKISQSQEKIAQLQSSTTLQASAAQIASAKDLQAMQGSVSTAIANIQANTSMSNQDKQDATSKIIAGIQSNTSLSVQDKASAAQTLIAAANNETSKTLARIQADTSLSITDKQNLSAQVIAGMNNTNARTVQQMVNDGNLATVRANGAINVEITNLTNTNRLLLQTSSAASSIYSTALSNMAAIMNSVDLNEDQKTSSLNNIVSGLKDSLAVISSIANNQSVTSTLNFTSPATPSSITLSDGSTIQIPNPVVETPIAPLNPTTPPTTPRTSLINQPTTTMQTSQGPVTSTPALDNLNRSYASSGITGPDDPRFRNFQAALEGQYKATNNLDVLQSQLNYQMSRLNDPVAGESAAALVQALQAQIAKVSG